MLAARILQQAAAPTSQAPQDACDFDAWGPEWRAVRAGCSAVGPISDVPWAHLKQRLRSCADSKRVSSKICTASSFVLPLLHAQRLALGFPERRVLQQLCALLGAPQLCPKIAQSVAEGQSSLVNECPLGTVSLVLGALAAGGAERDASSSAHRQRRGSQLVIKMAASYLQDALPLFRLGKTISVVHVVLSGWPLFNQLRSLRARVRRVRRRPTPQSALFERPTSVYSRRIARWARNGRTQLAGCAVFQRSNIRVRDEASSTGAVARSCLCRAMKPLAIADTDMWHFSMANASGGGLWIKTFCGQKSGTASLATEHGRGTRRETDDAANQASDRRNSCNLVPRLSLPQDALLVSLGLLQDLIARIILCANGQRHGLCSGWKADTKTTSWPADFVLGAMAIDSFLGQCAVEAGLLPSLRPAALTWKMSVWPIKQESQRALSGHASHHRTAWATLLTDDAHDPARFGQWLDALSVLQWSLQRAHGDLPRPFLVLCDGESAPSWLFAALRKRTLLPVFVQAPEVPPPPGTALRKDLAFGWLRLHLWRLVEFDRIVYFDVDVLVVGSLEPLFKLPRSVHFAAVPLGPERVQNVNVGVMVVTPDSDVYKAMLDALSMNLLHDHPEFRRGGFLDQAWLDLFLRWFSALPRGGRILWDRILGKAKESVETLEVADVCPRPHDVVEPLTLRQAPLKQIPGGNAVPLGVCLLDPGFNFGASLPILNWPSESALAGQPFSQLVGHAFDDPLALPPRMGVRILHWAGDIWKPWDRVHGVPWTRSVTDEIWWAARQQMMKEKNQSTRLRSPTGAELYPMKTEGCA